jgi:hypothetical protein
MQAMSYTTKGNSYATRLVGPCNVPCVQLIMYLIVIHGIFTKYWLFKLTICANIKLSIHMNGHLPCVITSSLNKLLSE